MLACCTQKPAVSPSEPDVAGVLGGPTTYVIIGASSGIGLELVKQLALQGDKVYATCRKRGSSLSGVDALSGVSGDVTIIEGIDIAQDSVAASLAASALAGKTIDVIIHNAGSINGTRDVAAQDVMAEQKLDNISMDCMRAAFEVNTLGPLHVQQALSSQMKSPGGKVAIISTGLASIADNTSGGNYAYRSSKAGVNMITKSMSCEFKAQEIPVVAIAPGFIATEFGPGNEKLLKMGAKPVDQCVKGIIQVVSGMNMETTGSFMIVPSNGEAPKTMPW